MRPIDKFILHIVHNWRNELNEAYSEGTIKSFIKKFSEEAEDLNISISEDQLRVYIQRFDVLKNSPKITEKDLDKYTIGQLIRLITSSKGTETVSDDEDQTPDVVYNENGIIIWNGSKEDNCITYGRGEKWCITRGSYGNYRYSSDRGYPTFYLAKNNNLSDDDKLSFVAIQVRDVDSESQRYVYTNRKNNPYESNPMSFSGLMSGVPWLNSIPNIRSILKYIPLSNKEKLTQQYKKKAISIREWVKFPFETKKQYLVVRKDKDLFDDINNDEFISKYLPQYPQIAEFIAITPEIINNISLLKNLDKFSNQDRKSITANLQQPVNISYLSSESLPFDVKKLLVTLKKWNISIDERLYITKDGSVIVKLKLGDDISVSLYTAEDDYPNIRLNKRTSKYLLDYPELDKIPFNLMVKLVSEEVIDKNVLDSVIEKAKTDKNSAIIVKKVGDKEILIDSNSFASYKIEGDKITKALPTDEEIQTAFAEEKDNTSFQQNAIDLIQKLTDEKQNIPASIDKDAFISIINAAPYDKRTLNINNTQYIVLIPDGESIYTIFTKNINLYENFSNTGVNFGRRGNWNSIDFSDPMDEGAWKAYFNWMRNENKVYESNQLIRIFKQGYISSDVSKAFFRAQPPFSPTDQYTPAIGGNGIYYLVNKANPRDSYKISETSGKLIKASIPPTMARQLTGATPDEATPTAPAAQAAPGAPRRGRPAGGGTPRAAAPAAPAAAGNINVAERMAEVGLETAFLRLPRNDYRRLNVTNAVRSNPNNDRGASRRNNQLGGAGSVGQVIEIGNSKIYIIRLANQQIIASINIQPGNRNYILFGNENGNIALSINSPSELMQALQQRNLAEMRNYLVREYLANNPQHLNKVSTLIRQYIDEIKNH